MPLRNPHPDPRWDERPSGLILPRGVGKTRRFIQKFGQAQCCCQDQENILPACTYGNHYDDTDEVTVDVTGTHEWIGMSWVLDGSYTLTNKTASGDNCEWTDGFTVQESGGDPLDAQTMTITATCSCDEGYVQWGVDIEMSGILGSGYGMVKWITAVPHAYSTPGYGDIPTRYFSDYGTPDNLIYGASSGVWVNVTAVSVYL